MLGAERAQALVDALVAAVDLGRRCRSSTRPPRRAPRSASPCRRGCPGSSSRSPYSLRRAGDDRAVRVAEDDPRAHADELVDEEEPALEHLLEDQHRAVRLRGGRRPRSRSGRPGRPATGRPRSSGSGRRGRPGSTSSWPGGTRTLVSPTSTWTPSRSNAGRIETRSPARRPRSSGRRRSTAARPMKLADLDVLGRDPPLAAAEPLDALDAEHVRLDPLDAARRARPRKRQRSWTCGSQAALPITVSPCASTAAMTAFSVAITLASSRKMRLPRSPSVRIS